MSFKPIPPIRGLSGDGEDTSSLKSSTSTSKTTASTTTTTNKEANKKLWCETQWTTLSAQAKNLGLPKLPYFDPKTMLLSKEVNDKLWRQLTKLYDHLGAAKAPYATPIMIEGGEVKWYSYLDGSKGGEAEIYDR